MSGIVKAGGEDGGGGPSMENAVGISCNERDRSLKGVSDGIST